MNHYLDTSVIVSMILNDANTEKAVSWFAMKPPAPLISTFTKAEFSAVISRQVRIRQQTVSQAQSAILALERWLDKSAQIVTCTNEDITSADMLVRNFATKLNAPDAIHLAIARRAGAALATFDQRLAEAARRHVVSVTVPGDEKPL